MDSILYRDKEGVIQITDEGMAIPAFRELYKKDKTRAKKSWRKWIILIYNMYHRKSVYKHIDTERAKGERIVQNIFDEHPKYYVKYAEIINDAAREFCFLHLLEGERTLLRHQHDISIFEQKISKIPWTKIEKHTISKNGADTIIEKEVDNSEEKLRALKIHRELMKHKEDIYKDIERERRSVKRSGGNTDKKTILEEEQSRK